MPHFAEMLEEAYEEGTLPTTPTEALLIALPKPGKDPQRCDSYRPLSLIDIDAKIFGKNNSEQDTTTPLQLNPTGPSRLHADAVYCPKFAHNILPLSSIGPGGASGCCPARHR